jgi:succinate dehydrogenase / fumarate reductase cytochrome b subunit
MNQATDVPERPLSPHLQVYRWGITNTLSILHRATGVFLSLGALILSCWLIALAIGEDSFAGVMALYGHPLFKLPLAAFAFCFFYHLGNGLRHLVWDTGRGFSHVQIAGGGIAVVVFAVVATVVYGVVGLV